MTTLFAPTALLPDGWADQVLIEIDKEGWIIGVDVAKDLSSQENVEVVTGPLLAGIPNAHSHAFQRALAGLVERAGGRKGTFWNWRETMYRFQSVITVEDMEPLAAQVFVEMLKAGYTSVGEFHYLHHAPNGQPYADTALMSAQVIRAALETGIAITHLPALYAYGGFGDVLPSQEQRRFINDVPSLMRILEELYGEFRSVPQVTLGLAHHSLRAVSLEMMKDATLAARALLPDLPIHILIAAQMQEVQDCMIATGRRPVHWLLDQGIVDKGWCLVHATHVTAEEVTDLAATGATVALCPTAEANAGGGVFPLPSYLAEGGVFALGSGSNVTLNPFEEMRWLEYTQRLARHERAVLARPDLPATGAVLFEGSVKGGAQALGRKTGRIESGYRADFIVLDKQMPSFAGKLRDHVLDAAVFAASENAVRDVMSGGRWVIRDRHHKREEKIAENFRKVMRKLR